MKVAILYIATGKYFIFWDQFFQTAKQYLFADRERELKFFVFTDQERSLGEDVHVTVVRDEPWPYPTLKRYHYFLQLKEQLLTHDYVYFFNGNTTFLKPIGLEILPRSGTDFVFVQQPFTLAQNNTEFGYERRKESKAFIPLGEGRYYIWGAFNGGKPDKFLRLAEVIKGWTDEDLKLPLISAFWDESYLNRYLLELNSNSYTLVENNLFLVDGYNDNRKDVEKTAAIHILEKSKFFDTSFKRKKSIADKVKERVKSLIGK